MADFQQLTDNSYQRTLTNAESIRVATAEQMTSVDAKLAALEEKIERVTNCFFLHVDFKKWQKLRQPLVTRLVLFQIRQMMLKLDQPVSFDAQSYEEVDNPRVDLLNQLHNEVLISCQECM